MDGRREGRTEGGREDPWCAVASPGCIGAWLSSAYRRPLLSTMPCTEYLPLDPRSAVTFPPLPSHVPLFSLVTSPSSPVTSLVTFARFATMAYVNSSAPKATNANLRQRRIWSNAEEASLGARWLRVEGLLGLREKRDSAEPWRCLASTHA